MSEANRDVIDWPAWLKSASEQWEIGVLRRENERLRIQLEQLRAEVGRREEAAYRDGLGDRARVLAESRVLATAIAGLIDRRHPLNLRT